MYKFKETKRALKDWQKIKSMSQSGKERWKEIFKNILNSPRDKKAIGNPEELKHTYIEVWSRELSRKDRIVYGIEPGVNYDMPDELEIIVFYQYLGHYADK